LTQTLDHWRRLGVLAAFVPALAHAQQGLSISTGELRVSGRPALSALTLAPEITKNVSWLSVWTAGQFALANTGSTRTLLSTSLTTRRPLLFGVAPVALIRGQDDALASDVRNRRVDGALGLRIGSDALGASASVGVARSAHASTTRAVQTANADLHLARGAFRLRLGYAGNAFDASTAMAGSNSGFSLTRTRLSDVTSDASWKYRGAEVGGFVGRRVGGSDDRRVWGGGFASVALSDRLAIVARSETAPSDPTRHLASQQLTTLGFRIRPSVARARFDDGSDAAEYRREFVLYRVAGTDHRIRVYMPEVHAVELAGSFNEWKATAMRATGGGWWELVVPLAPGLYTLNVRADEGRWMVPPGLTTAIDEFSGAVGVLHIPD
jgi:hypothetical protein